MIVPHEQKIESLVDGMFETREQEAKLKSDIQPARPNEDLSPSIIKYRRQNRVLMFTSAVLGVGVITWMMLSILLQPDSKQPTNQPATQAESGLEAELANAVPLTATTVKEATSSHPAEAADSIPEKEVKSVVKTHAAVKESRSAETKPTVEPKSLTTGPNIDLPTFFETSDGWRMLLRMDQASRFKYFSLENPTRLVVDIIESKFVGTRNFLQSPTPFIRALRIGKREGYVRLVLDFGTGDLPLFTIKKTAEGLNIHFKK
jgi:AMIN domain-containing protein